MTRLLRAELLRYWSRRAVRAVAILALGGVVFACFIVAINSNNDPADVAQARTVQVQAQRQCEQAFQGPVPEGYDSVEEFCADQNVALDPRFHLTEMFEVLQGLSFLLVILAIGLGASFVGADWSAGTMTTILTWEPRRVRVYAMKAVAAAIFIFVGALLAQAVLVLAMWVVAAWRGTLAGVDAEWVGDLTMLALRSSAVCAVMGTIGMALAMVARVTVAAVIVAFVYFAVLENVIRGFRPNWVRWLLGDNIAVFVLSQGDVEIGDGFILSETRGLVTMLCYAALFFLVALSVFRSRDVS